MTRAEFVRVFADCVAERRARQGTVRPSEAAMNRMSDEQGAAKLWNKHRATYLFKTPQQFRNELRAARTED